MMTLFIVVFPRKLVLSNSICKDLGALPGVTQKIIRRGFIEDLNDLIELELKGIHPRP